MGSTNCAHGATFTFYTFQSALSTEFAVEIQHFADFFHNYFPLPSSVPALPIFYKGRNGLVWHPAKIPRLSYQL